MHSKPGRLLPLDVLRGLAVFGILLVFGLLHGFLLWSGDVLASYAVAGMLILPLAAARLSRVRNRAWRIICCNP